MINRYEDIPKLFKNIDFFLITDKNGYITYYEVINNLGSRIVKNPVGMHILELHQHLTPETSTIMRALKLKEPIINEKQYLNIFKERTVTILATTLPLISGDDVIGTIEIDRYLDEDLAQYEEEDFNNNINQNNYFFTIDDIITNNPTMIEVKNQTLKAAKTSSPVMIYGETGTGKELIAQAIHNHSFRKDNPFIVQNCASIPSSLGESILFGTTKGSFTGAENKAGLFEIANGGTLVLDELNSMDIALQSKLLRVTENGHFRRLGGKNIINVDVRLISTINEDPYLLIESNKIRKDLFYRLGVVLIYLPPLRDRKDDIPLLIDSFINEYNKKMQKKIKGISKEVKELVMDYNWPGNVRELKNFIEGAFNFAEKDIIDRDSIPYHIISIDKNNNSNIDIESKFDLNEALKEQEIKYIKLALEKSKTITDAAKLLKISRQLLKYKLDSYGIETNHN
ncbi:MAG TPA: sigma 54-interacting transcriptional regulator [Tissierellia bacterium]|nr:sigma 54-interacting transcriptional regulator [Tissierellia bacterium]